MSRAFSGAVDLAVRQWSPRVAEAAAGFEARWTARAVRNFDVKLGAAFEAARGEYRAAVVGGTATEISATAERLCRAYGVISAELGAAEVPDDAYQIGSAPGFVVVVSASPIAAERARRLHPFAVHYTADEIAALLVHSSAAQAISDVKRVFPGAEVLDVRERAG